MPATPAEWYRGDTTGKRYDAEEKKAREQLLDELPEDSDGTVSADAVQKRMQENYESRRKAYGAQPQQQQGAARGTLDAMQAQQNQFNPNAEGMAEMGYQWVPSSQMPSGGSWQAPGQAAPQQQTPQQQGMIWISDAGSPQGGRWVQPTNVYTEPQQPQQQPPPGARPLTGRELGNVPGAAPPTVGADPAVPPEQPTDFTGMYVQNGLNYYSPWDQPAPRYAGLPGTETGEYVRAENGEWVFKPFDGGGKPAAEAGGKPSPTAPKPSATDVDPEVARVARKAEAVLPQQQLAYQQEAQGMYSRYGRDLSQWPEAERARFMQIIASLKSFGQNQ
jgi:hypothetical protein